MGEILSHPVRDLITRAPVTVGPDATLRQVAHQLWADDVGIAVVTEDERPVGVVSERDLVSAMATGADPDTMLAAQVMTRAVLTASTTDRVLSAVIDMIDRGFRHLPVFDDAGRCVGVVSMRELMRPMLLDALEPPA
jgi:CBS domain-containing protein